MKLTKNEFKTIAKTASSIKSEGTESTFNGRAYHTSKTVSYEEMLEDLRHCSRWNANQYGNQIFACGAIGSFVIDL